MVLCTCLCLKKNAIQSINYSYGFCQRMTSSTPPRPAHYTRYIRFYSHSTAPSLLFRHLPFISLQLPSTRLPPSKSLGRSLQYPSSLRNRLSCQWRFMSAKAMPTRTTDLELDLQYETNGVGDDMIPIERLASTTAQAHASYRIDRSSTLASPPPPSTTNTFDTTALKSYVDAGQYGDALTLVLQQPSGSSDRGFLDFPTEDRQLFLTRLGELPVTELVDLLEPFIHQQQQQRTTIYNNNNNKRLMQLLKSLGSHLPMDSVQHLLHQFPLDHHVQSVLFSRFVKNYMVATSSSSISQSASNGEAQLDVMLDFLSNTTTTTSTADSEKGLLSEDIKTRLYNMALNGCLKRQQWTHVDKVLARMASSHGGCSLDTISYNMLIRSRLDQGDVDAANALYDQLTHNTATSAVTGTTPPPTTATFNTFIKYACEQQRWDMMGLWLDRLLRASSNGPNQVTLRILVAALTDHMDQPTVVDAFQRVAMMVAPGMTNTTLETTIHVSIIHLLRQKQTDTALAILDKLFGRSSSSSPALAFSVYTYNLFIHALVQKGDLEAAEQVLACMRRDGDLGNQSDVGITSSRPPLPDIVSYTTLIHGYIRSANSHDMDIGRISALYKELMGSGIETNATLQAVILYGMVKSGFQAMEEYATLFESMVEEEHGDPRQQQYSNTHYHDDGKQTMDPKLSRMTMYNIMMDGYFLHHYYHRRRTHDHGTPHRSSSSSASSFSPTRLPSGLITAINNGRDDQHIPPEALTLLTRAIEKGLPLTTATLNIWVRGLAFFNHDLTTAEAMVKWMTLKHGVKMNERTIYYLVRTAIRHDRRDKARKWISLYENTGQTIQGTGLQYFKSMVIK
ncbi:hypothetical protein BCR42DRAFT_413191 [Absidia repens]|uniref:Pentacotripeptide-repeat region of PRORP domain-containing protein n=1 Tax=Absidia repens TaxID=90262 RepID=A0A1X2IKM1_9FUNG|nr:hypothetical protein BCR42DRAFT_413191 [Absidia repens]